MARWNPHAKPLEKCPRNILANFTPRPSYNCVKVGPWSPGRSRRNGQNLIILGGTQRVEYGVQSCKFFDLGGFAYVKIPQLAKKRT